MKKIKFLNGLSAACAFTVVAMIGSFLFTSCEKEDLNATFETGPAEITFNVKVYDVLSGDVTDKATVTGADKISQNGGYAGGKVTITATYDGTTGSTEVIVNPLKAGGEATYNVNVVLSSQYEVVVSEPKLITVEGELGDASHSHNNKNWCLNDNEYILTRSISYTVLDKQAASSNVTAIDLTELVKAMNYDKSYESVFDIKVSAWAYYRVWTERTDAETVYTVKRKGGADTFGTVTVNSVYSTAAQYEEAPFNSHYHYGHGHGVHGYDGNAGGGIVYPD
ncbi:DUF3869 domain-containing protein [uncultured Bacteroides sp.]|uniref:DUF3869 domain-containing protein n=1 Tax=uncultured Bacteroides sp. TaxID=162156 RepID=UPI0025D9056F|nr:DUF3869 domain-containing protein [uncultured Bacteroides sp.]